MPISKKQAQELVQEINKLARPFGGGGGGGATNPPPAPPPDQGGGGGNVLTIPTVEIRSDPVPPQGGADSTHFFGQKKKPSGGGGYYAPPAIRNMQLSLHALAKTISATIDYDALIKAVSTPPGQPPTEEKSAFEAQYGRDMFSNFMVSNYLRRADVHGVEYDTDPKRTKMLDKKPADLKAMFVILDSMRRIGAEPKESVADGNWGPRTNNALRNAAAIASAVMKLGAELGMESRAFDTNKITELNSLVPAKDTDISMQEKLQRAPKIDEILKGVDALFKDFKQQVFMDPTYRNFIEGKAPMMTFGPAKEKGVDASEGEKPILTDLQNRGWQSPYASHPAAKLQVTLDKRLIPQQFGQVDVKPFDISGGDLVSTQAFDNWVNRSNVLMAIKQGNPASWSAVIRSVLDQVGAQVDAKLRGGK